ncbi:Beta-glucanase [termite gut metagenome]|uniref:Beta-glucanase n=1 Tax=termite gut metagenome TaxID=433724 RepID=A0A5J4SDV4_9ZZZZ
MKYNLFSIVFASLLILISCAGDDGTTTSGSIKLNKTATTIKIGETETLAVVEAPVSDEPAVWSSEDANVATVFYGVVTAVSSGTTKITVTLGAHIAECVVTVPERSYELVWSDEFEGTSLNTDNWNYETGTGNWGWGNDEKQYYTNRSENIKVENGYLIIEAKKENYSGSAYTSARITTQNKQSFTYGKIEARLSIPSGTGTWPAFWMLGSKGGWPGCGEIDIMEHVGKEPKMLSHALHTKNKNGMNGQNWNQRSNLDDAENTFHTFTLEWVENNLAGYDIIRFYIDEKLTGASGETLQNTIEDWPFNTPFYFILNLAIGGTWGGTRH